MDLAHLDIANWARQLPISLTVLRMVMREGRKASSPDLVYGRTLPLPGDLSSANNPSQTEAAQRQFRDILRGMMPADRGNTKECLSLDRPLGVLGKMCYVIT
ncbi:hypothetical protein AAG570_009073 [Ranatra chinensis]|uniref:Uncharacterized protein n=1 Tax=Ranatra chinensis TaxID=642074 RepID=A0ABD0Z5K3_9HEMI